MTNKNIKIFGRIKPERYQKQTHYEIYQKDSKEELVIYPPRLMNQTINNSPYKYNFKFDKIFKYNCDQLEIFQDIAIPILDRIKKGSNGTIFAYGQTGSGKTFTMLGSILPNSYQGIIPRILQNLFNDKSTLRIALSYLEIYKDVGVDLLSRNCQRVIIQEDDAGIHLKHLQKVYVQDMQEAIKILQIGEENRKVSCNKYNTRSSRSHCILTIRYEGSESDKVILSYLHLVDLAGSERFKSSGFNLRAANESIHINKSLHFLEVVINALTYPTLRHVPYRNSLVTSVLKDSLNANSFTSMIATLSMAESNAFETLSSCRFASRMSKIKSTRIDVGKENKVNRKNQMLSLQDEVQRLHGLLVKDTNVKFQSYDNDLTDEDKRYCEAIVSKFLSEDNDTSSIPVTECKHIQECFRIIRKRVKQIQKQVQNDTSNDDSTSFVENDRKKQDFKTTYREDFSQNQRMGKVIHNTVNNNSYEEQPIRTSLFIPNNLSINNKKVRIIKSKKGNRRKIAASNRVTHKTDLNFDEYLEKNSHSPSNNHTSIFLSDRSLNKKSPFSSNCLSTSRSKNENQSISTTKLSALPKSKISAPYIPNSHKHIYPSEAKHSFNSIESNAQNQRQSNPDSHSCCSHNMPLPISCLESQKSSCCQRMITFHPESCCGTLSARSNYSYINSYIPCCLNSTPAFQQWSTIRNLQNQLPQYYPNHQNDCGDGTNSRLDQNVAPRIEEQACEESSVRENNNTVEFVEIGDESTPLYHCQNNATKEIPTPNLHSFAKDVYIKHQLKKPNLENFLSKITMGQIANFSTNPFENSLKFSDNSKDTTCKSPQRQVNTNPFLEDIIEHNTKSTIPINHTINSYKPIINNSPLPSYTHWRPNISLTNQDIIQDNPRKSIYSDSTEKHYILPGTESKIPLTGDKEIDEEIIKFYKCRELAKITKVS